MKNFQKFLEEVSIRGSEGIPGQPRRRSGESDYLGDVERRAKQRMQFTGRENPMVLGQRLMELLEQSLRFTSGKERELEKLAKDVIFNQYETILDGVELDIRLVQPGRAIKDFMEESEPDNPQPQREIKDKDVIDEISKRKIANNIIQGEAKNTKSLLHIEEVKDGLEEIFGEERGKQIHAIWDEMSKLASKLDWMIPPQIKGRMMEDMPEGLAGAVKVDWKPKKNDDEDEDFADKVLNDLQGNKDLNDFNDDEELGEKIGEMEPVIRARGIDFPMLLHEAVKGIYELIAAVGIPEDPELARKVFQNTSSFEDEAEEFQYGPEIAGDLRDFVNENTRIDEYPNLREFFFGEMMKMPAHEFLEFMRAILNKSTLAKRKRDQIIAELLSNIKSEVSEIEASKKASTEVEDHPKEPTSGKETGEEDYSTWTKSEIQEAIDKALDDEDYDKVKKLSQLPQFLKEGKIYQRELDIVYGRKNLHTK